MPKYMGKDNNKNKKYEVEVAGNLLNWQKNWNYNSHTFGYWK
jgi:hypothetical protein